MAKCRSQVVRLYMVLFVIEQRYEYTLLTEHGDSEDTISIMSKPSLSATFIAAFAADCVDSALRAPVAAIVSPP